MGTQIMETSLKVLGKKHFLMLAILANTTMINKTSPVFSRSGGVGYTSHRSEFDGARGRASCYAKMCG